MTTFCVALYNPEGNLVKTYVGEPLWLNSTAQQTADMVARSAEAGCSYPAGVVAVWADPDLEPAGRVGAGEQPDAIRAFGNGRPPMPAYRWVHGDDWSTTLIPA